MQRKTKHSKAGASPSTPIRLSTHTSAFFLSLYLLVDVIPESGAIDVMGPQWLYLSIVNPVVMAYILVYKRPSLDIVGNLSSNSLVICYTLFFIFSGLSIFFAINPIESLVVYSRLATGILVFFNICILLYGQPKTFKTFCQIVSISALILSSSEIYFWLNNVNAQIDGNTGNKNIFAAGLITRLPFIMYCVFTPGTFFKNLLNAVALFSVTLMIFLLTARSAYIALIIQLVVYLALVVKSNFLKTDLTSRVARLSRVFAPFVLAFICAQLFLIKRTVEVSTATAPTVVTRLSTIVDRDDASINARLFFWRNALNHIKDYPLTGCGYGNWKILSVSFESQFNDDFNFSKQVHNDFLQIAAECGLHTALLFLGLFIISLIFTIKIITSTLSTEIKFPALFSSISLSGYFVDANFNFPADHPSMQVIFISSLAFLVVAFISLNQSRKKPFTANFYSAAGSIFFLLAAGCIYINYNTYKSMRVQVNTHYDFGRETQQSRWTDIDGKFPIIPNLTENNIPVDIVKSWYLLRESRYNDALSFLNKENNANPYAMYNEWLKATIFYSINRPDSAYYYATNGFKARPRNFPLFSLLARTGALVNDPQGIIKAFNQYKKYRDEPHAWMIYIRSLFAANYDPQKVIAIADSVSAAHEDNLELKHTKFFVRAGVEAMNGNYAQALTDLKEILKIYPNDYETIENIGLTYYFLHDYTLANTYFSRVIASQSFTNGKSEYYLGQGLMELGRRDEACRYLAIAASKKYPNADITFRNNHCE